MRKESLLILTSSILLQLNAFAQPPDNFYRGRTITILVGSGPGGTTDITARVIARHLSEHIPGAPTVIVQNMPGGGSVTMTNHVYRSAAKNGTVLGYSLPGIVTAQLLEPQRAKYDAGDLSWIGSALKYTGIVSVLDSAPAVTIEQARKTELFIGTTGRGSPAYQYPAMAHVCRPSRSSRRARRALSQ
jgi:tripartite-type tricarboxylate transporter receptor subunit TctC